MNPLKERYYLGEIFKTKLGNSHGVIIKAKPIYLLTIIDNISCGFLKENKLYFNDKNLLDRYNYLYNDIMPDMKISPMILPFYHLSSESYYEIKWSGVPFRPSPKGHSPSGRYLTNNYECASLDNGLWDILQDTDSRKRFRNEIFNYFFKPANQ